MRIVKSGIECLENTHLVLKVHGALQFFAAKSGNSMALVCAWKTSWMVRQEDWVVNLGLYSIFVGSGKIPGDKPKYLPISVQDLRAWVYEFRYKDLVLLSPKQAVPLVIICNNYLT